MFQRLGVIGFSIFFVGCVILPPKVSEPLSENTIKRAKKIKIVANNRIQQMEQDGWFKDRPSNIAIDHSKITNKLYLFDEPKYHNQLDIFLCGKNCTDTDIEEILYLDLYEHIEFNKIGTFFSIFTLTVIPGNEARVLRIKGTLVDKNGKYLATYDETEKVEYWYNIFLLPLLPFQNFEAPNIVMSSITAKILKDADSKGLLK